MGHHTGILVGSIPTTASQLLRKGTQSRVRLSAVNAVPGEVWVPALPGLARSSLGNTTSTSYRWVTGKKPCSKPEALGSPEEDAALLWHRTPALSCETARPFSLPVLCQSTLNANDQVIKQLAEFTWPSLSLDNHLARPLSVLIFPWQSSACSGLLLFSQANLWLLLTSNCLPVGTKAGRGATALRQAEVGLL